MKEEFVVEYDRGKVYFDSMKNNQIHLRVSERCFQLAIK